MSTPDADSVQERLRFVFLEMRKQSQLGEYFGDDSLAFEEEMEQLREFIEDAAEYGIAYESIVSALETVPFTLSGKAAICLVEVGLIFGYKTERPSDRHYDRRHTE